MIEPTLEVLSGWAMACQASGWVYRPRDAGEVESCLRDAAARGLTVVHRGAGLSYGDAALNSGGAVVETRALRAPLEVDREQGTMRAGAGATIEDVWRAAVPLGWWPPVVPGTMHVTVGGCVAMDVHGKNHFRQGSFGEHVESLVVLEPGGGARTLTREANPELLARVIGAQGLTGTILEVTLRLERIHSGHLEVEALSAPTLGAMMDMIEEGAAGSPHAVGWLDCFARGRGMGRGIVHLGRPLAREHPLAGRGLDLADQSLPGRILGMVPRRWAWRTLLPFANDPGMRALNLGRVASGRVGAGRRYAQSHAAFHFLLDYVPGWKRVYGRKGFLQYQLFVPRASARAVFAEAIRLQHALGVHAWLGVLKRHRAGRFAAPYSVDGFSLALDIPVRPSRADALARLCRSYQDLLRDSGGEIYAAKDAVGVGRLPRERHPLFASDLVRRWEAGGDA